MSEIILKVGGNGIMRQAKNAIMSDTLATTVKKGIRKNTLINVGFTAANGACTAIQASGGKTGWAITAGICTALCSLMTGASINKFIKASKVQKQSSQAVKDIVSKKDFIDVLNRYLRINGKKEMTSEQFLQVYNKGNKAKAVKQVLQG